MKKQPRYEYKYLIPVNIFERVKSSMMPFLRLDKFAEEVTNNIYTVRSIYYDTVNLEAYFEKIDGIRKRKKIRIRGYNQQTDDSVVFVEIKRKYENLILKNRAGIYYKDIEKFLITGDIKKYVVSDSGSSFGRDASRFYYNIKVKSLRPVILITYDRAAYHGVLNDKLRITFDMDLRSKLMPTMSELYDEKSLMPAMRDFVILEVKFHDTLPRWLINIISHFNLVRLSVSKYTICLDSHRLFSTINKQLAFTSAISAFN